MRDRKELRIFHNILSTITPFFAIIDAIYLGILIALAIAGVESMIQTGQSTWLARVFTGIAILIILSRMRTMYRALYLTKKSIYGPSTEDIVLTDPNKKTKNVPKEE